jgi:hypothetical protein
VTITGEVAEAEVAALRAALTYDAATGQTTAGSEWGPLSFDPLHPGGAGLGDWPAPTISATGNLSETDLGPEHVAAHLRQLVGVAPSLNVAVHCGGDWETPACVATVTAAGGVVSVGPPQVPHVGDWDVTDLPGPVRVLPSRAETPGPRPWAAGLAVLWPLSGPYSSTQTATAAEFLAQMARYLPHAANPDGLPDLRTLHHLLSALAEAAGNLQQVLRGASRELARLSTDPAVDVDDFGEPLTAYDAATRCLRGLTGAGLALIDVREALSVAQSAAGRLYRRQDTE